ncbi:MAG: hypothetical protein H7Y22_08720 [Gemmatimonadaceae bacterium]|nr:hypothetical protein [Gloeobacterales cyanobacterium ES-bin-141]
MRTLHIVSGVLGPDAHVQRAWFADGLEPETVQAFLVCWQLILAQPITAVAIDGELLDLLDDSGFKESSCDGRTWGIQAEFDNGDRGDAFYMQGLREDLFTDGSLDFGNPAWRVFLDFGTRGMVNHTGSPIVRVQGARCLEQQPAIPKLWTDIVFAMDLCLFHLPTEHPAVSRWEQLREAADLQQVEAFVEDLANELPAVDANLARRLLRLQVVLQPTRTVQTSTNLVEEDQLWAQLEQLIESPAIVDSSIESAVLLPRSQVLTMLGIGDNAFYRLQGGITHIDNDVRKRCHPLRFLPTVRKGQGQGAWLYRLEDVETYLRWKEASFDDREAPPWLPEQWKSLKMLNALPPKVLKSVSHLGGSAGKIAANAGPALSAPTPPTPVCREDSGGEAAGGRPDLQIPSTRKLVVPAVADVTAPNGFMAGEDIDLDLERLGRLLGAMLPTLLKQIGRPHKDGSG